MYLIKAVQHSLIFPIKIPIHMHCYESYVSIVQRIVLFLVYTLLCDSSDRHIACKHATKSRYLMFNALSSLKKVDLYYCTHSLC